MYIYVIYVVKNLKKEKRASYSRTKKNLSAKQALSQKKKITIKNLKLDGVRDNIIDEFLDYQIPLTRYGFNEGCTFRIRKSSVS